MLAYLNVALTYVAVALGCAILMFYVVRREMPGRFWGALVVGLVGAVLGGIADQLLAGVFERLTDVNTVNLYAAGGASLLCIWLLSIARRRPYLPIIYILSTNAERWLAEYGWGFGWDAWRRGHGPCPARRKPATRAAAPNDRSVGPSRCSTW